MNINKILTETKIEDYNPSQVNNYYTVLQQLEFIKSLLQKYPSQQFFTVKQGYSSNATTIATANINSDGRVVGIGDLLFINVTNKDNVLGLFMVQGFSGANTVVKFINTLNGAQGVSVTEVIITKVEV